MKLFTFFFIFLGLCLSTGAQHPDKVYAEIELLQTEYNISAPGNAVKKHSARIIKYSPNAPFSNLVIPYDKNSKVSSIEVRILDVNGKELRKFKKADIHDVMTYSGNLIDDHRLKVVELAYGVYPHILEYSYEVNYDNHLIIEDFSPCEPHTRLKKAQLLVTYPKDMPVKYKWVNQFSSEVNIQDSKDQKTLVVELNDIEPMSNPSSEKREASKVPHFVFMPEEFNFDGHKGDFKSWSSFGNFMTQLNAPQEKITPEIQATVNRLVSGVQNNNEKVSRLYQYLQENFRYVSIQLGIGGWRAFDAEYVHKNAYGDCKALSNYMKTMLRAANIPSHLVLVGAGEDYTPQVEAFANPSFNHMILYVPEEDMWLECTSKSLPAGFLGEFTAGRNALICNGEESHLKKTPELTLEDNTREVDLQLTLKSNGANQLRVRRAYGRAKANDVLGTWNQLKRDELDQYLHSQFNLPGAKIDSSHYAYDKATGKGVLTYVFSSVSVGSKTGKRMFIPLQSFINLDISSLLQLPSEDGRAQSYTQSYPERSSFALHLNLEPGVLVEAMPPNQLLNYKDLASFEIKSEKAAGSLQIHIDYVFKQGTVPAAELKELQAFLAQVQKVINSKLVLVQGP